MVKKKPEPVQESQPVVVAFQKPLRLVYMSPAELVENPHNWRRHPEGQIATLTDVISEVGWAGACLFNQATGRLLDGHARRKVALEQGTERVPVLVGNWTEEQEKKILATLDPIASMATADAEKLDALLREVNTGSEAIAGLLDSLARDAGIVPGEDSDTPSPLENPASSASLADRFIVPPFSVLDARQGYWQDRKRAWLALGIRSELGRGQNALGREAECDNYQDSKGDYARADGSGGPGTLDAQRKEWGSGPAIPGGAGTNAAWRKGGAKASQAADLSDAERVARQAKPGGNRMPACDYRDGQKGDGHGRPVEQGTLAPGRNGRPIDGRCADGTEAATGTSIFDPVLCELAYRWFCPPDGLVLDPFAGGSVRGIVAARLGRRYVGIDLRAEQTAANEEQAGRIPPGHVPRWLAGDSVEVATIAPGEYDFVFSCPPYADLEVYSDNPRDLSTMNYPAFLAAYRHIIAATVGMLRPDRFACFVVGDVRDDKGLYRNFVGDTVAAFRDAGARLYNDAVLVTMVGSLPVRVGKQFMGYRKLGKTHQNVLVFCKGDPRRATSAVGPVEAGDIADGFGEVLRATETSG